MKKFVYFCLLSGLLVLSGCTLADTENQENKIVEVLYESEIPSSAVEMEHTFYDGVNIETVKYECNGDTYMQITEGPSNYFCDGELVNVACYLQVKDDQPLYFYHLEKIGCEDLSVEHPEVF